MFKDQVKVKIEAGKGGNGIVAFRREKFVQFGGPSGGDGGHGGNVIVKVDEGLNTLMDFHYNDIFKAPNGGNGMPKKMHGKSAKNAVIKVPAGTTIYDADTNEPICDMVHKNDHYVLAKGGRGGRGNIHFASAKNPAPEIAENGEPGQKRNIRLELKMLADVGLVGFPSVGKSTLLSAITGSNPKIAGYHFTTLVPNLGMVELPDGRDFAIADMPGLIKGASKGVGLGFKFLRHIERTRVLLHLVDMSGIEARDTFKDYYQINQELKDYDPHLLDRPQIIVASKMDMPQSKANLKKFKNALDKSDLPNRKIIPISAITHYGLKELIRATAKLLETTPRFPITDVAPPKPKAVHKFKKRPPFTVSRNRDGNWVLSGPKIDKLFAMTDKTHRQSLIRFARKAHGMGVDKALRKAGAKNGDTILIQGRAFTFQN
ncbi:MAG: GTPase ObgE [Acetilactobacillus jinshanensis]